VPPVLRCALLPLSPCLAPYHGFSQHGLTQHTSCWWAEVMHAPHRHGSCLAAISAMARTMCSSLALLSTRPYLAGWAKLMSIPVCHRTVWCRSGVPDGCKPTSGRHGRSAGGHRCGARHGAAAAGTPAEPAARLDRGARLDDGHQVLSTSRSEVGGEGRLGRLSCERMSSCKSSATSLITSATVPRPSLCAAEHLASWWHSEMSCTVQGSGGSFSGLPCCRRVCAAAL